MTDIKKLIEAVDKFAGEPKQKRADHARGTDKPKKGKGFLNKLVGESDRLKKQDAAAALEKRLGEMLQKVKEDDLGTKDPRPARPGSRPPRGHEPVRPFSEDETATNDNFTAADLKRLETIRDLDQLKQEAIKLVSNSGKRAMKPEKISYFTRAIESKRSAMDIIKLMYDLLLSGEGFGTIGTAKSTRSNSYRQRFSEQDITEAPIDFDSEDPMNPMVYGHAGGEAINPGKLKYREQLAQSQIKDLAAQGSPQSPGEWKSYLRNLSELSRNVKTIVHGYEELQKIKQQGGSRSNNIDPSVEINEVMSSPDYPATWAGAETKASTTKNYKTVAKFKNIEEWNDFYVKHAENLKKFGFSGKTTVDPNSARLGPAPDFRAPTRSRAGAYIDRDGSDLVLKVPVKGMIKPGDSGVLSVGPTRMVHTRTGKTSQPTSASFVADTGDIIELPIVNGVVDFSLVNVGKSEQTLDENTVGGEYTATWTGKPVRTKSGTIQTGDTGTITVNNPESAPAGSSMRAPERAVFTRNDGVSVSLPLRNGEPDFRMVSLGPDSDVALSEFMKPGNTTPVATAQTKPAAATPDSDSDKKTNEPDDVAELEKKIDQLTRAVKR